jgi:CHAD domain
LVAFVLEPGVSVTREVRRVVRAVARLVRPALGDDFDQFNDMLRAAADALAPIRDAHSMLATFEDLRTRHGLVDDAELESVRSAQLAAIESATWGVNRNDLRIDHARTLLVASRKQIKRWAVPDGFATLEIGIENSYRRGQRALGRARDKPTGCTNGAGP